MTDLTSHQRRALSAAAGLVGRPHLRAGLLLTLAVACGPAPDDSADASSSTGTATTGTTTAALTTPNDPTTTGAEGDTSTSTASTSLADPTTTTPDDTSSTTLLTDATTTTGTTGDTTTGDTTTLDTTTATTGDLDDCLDPRTLEVDWLCCENQGWQPSPQCTPWGPPAPPDMSRDLLARARAARKELA